MSKAVIYFISLILSILFVKRNLNVLFSVKTCLTPQESNVKLELRGLGDIDPMFLVVLITCDADANRIYQLETKFIKN